MLKKLTVSFSKHFLDYSRESSRKLVFKGSDFSSSYCGNSCPHIFILGGMPPILNFLNPSLGEACPTSKKFNRRRGGTSKSKIDEIAADHSGNIFVNILQAYT